MKVYVMLPSSGGQVSIFAVVDAILLGNNIDHFNNLFLPRRTQNTRIINCELVHEFHELK